LPWNVPAEYEHFLDSVRGHPVIMGRTSFEIFGADLDRSPTVVVSRSLERLPGVEIATSVEDAIARASVHGPRVFGAGGATIYRQMLPRADALWLSIVPGEFAGDAYFPEIDEAVWTVSLREDRGPFEFRVYRRVADRPEGGTGSRAQPRFSART
jgi:dihydrofolate reductase